MKIGFRIRTASFTFGLIVSGVAQAQTYQFVDLGTSNPPKAISNSFIVGNMSTTPSQGYFRSWTSGVVGSTTVIPGSTEARAVNDAGVVTGFYTTALVVNAFRWTIVPPYTATPTYLGATPSFGYGINSFGDVCGWNDQVNQACVWWASGSLVNYPAPFVPSGTASYSYGINYWGDHVGYARFGNSTSPIDASAAWIPTVQSGWINLGVNGVATGINTSRSVVGTCYPTANVPRAYTWTSTGGIVYPINTTYQSTANAINDAGFIVGNYRIPSAQYTTAYVIANNIVKPLSTITTGYTASSGSTPGIVAILDAYAINGNGDILGTALNFKGFGPWAPYETKYVLFRRTS